jgi:hypothetical protein
MNKITICDNVLSPESWQTYDCDDVREFLAARYPKMPDTAHIYHHYVADNCDVTPHDEASIELLGTLKGDFYLVILPEGIETILIIVAIAVAAISIGLSFLLRPKVKSDTATSSNNQLSDRTNKERIGERIPDIVGRVRSIPDLLSVPYHIFINNTEVEYSYMCIGRGEYTISDVRDDLTPLHDINGSSIEVYKPFTSPNSGDQPQYRIGTAIATPVFNVQEINSVNGQVLLAPNLPGSDWIGPFYITVNTLTDIWCNFVAEAGLFQVSKKGNQSALSVAIQLGITPIDGAGNPTDDETMFSITLTGSDVFKTQIGTTLKAPLPIPGAVAIRAIRLTDTILTEGVSVSDEIRWREAHGLSALDQTDFGNVTTVQSITHATSAALSLKQRKLNMLVTRNVPQYLGTGLGFGTALAPSRNAIDILCFLALDPLVGNRTLAELDVDVMYVTIAEIETYFGTDLCTHFSYTFDDANKSFEETAADIAAAVFCIAYRRGSLISLFFEKRTSDSTLLFNHRNKVPKSETRTVVFGSLNDYDGINLDYVDPAALNFPNVDSTITLYFPPDQSARNPQKITSIGIRNNVQAWIYGWRLYQKLIYQNTTVEFEATQEAASCVRMERIAVADNTRPDTQDGEVVAQAGLILTLSQPVNFISGSYTYIIYLQHYDDSVESIGITPGSDEYKVVLATAPTLPCVVDNDSFAKTTYIIVYTN